MKNDLKIIKPWPLKPETPSKKRKEIRDLEHEIDRLLVRRWRCVLALEMIAVSALVICLADCWGWVDLF